MGQVVVPYEHGNEHWVVPQNAGNFLTNWGNITFWKILLHGEEKTIISEDAILLLNTSTRKNSLTFILPGGVSKFLSACLMKKLLFRQR